MSKKTIIFLIITPVIIFSSIFLGKRDSDCITLTQVNTNNEKSTLIVKADGNYSHDDKKPIYGSWVKANIGVKTGDILKVNTEGTVNLNPFIIQNFPYSYSVADFDNLQYTQVKVSKDDYLMVSISQDPYKSNNKRCQHGNHVSNSGNPSSTCNYQDGFKSNCWGIDGMGVIPFIIQDKDQIPIDGCYNQGEYTSNNCIPLIKHATKNYSVEAQYGVSTSFMINNSAVLFHNHHDIRHKLLTNNIPDYQVGFSVKEMPYSGILAFQGIDHNNWHDNCGGYNFNIIHLPKAYGITDGRSLNNLGKVEMLITTQDPNVVPYHLNEVQILNDGQYHQEVKSSGNLWFKIHELSNEDYKDNIGEYYLSLETYTSTSNLGFVAKGLKGIIKPIMKQLDEVRAKLFSQFTSTSLLHRLIVALLTLYIIIYAIYFIFGITDVTQIDLVFRIFKIGLVLALIREDSWEFFYNHLFKVYTEGIHFLINNITSSVELEGIEPAESLFIFVDKTIGYFTSDKVFAKIFSLVWSPVDWLFLYFIVYSIIALFFTVLEAVGVFIYSYIGISLLIAISPLFIIGILFERTKDFFINWLKCLLNFTLQPAILLMLVGFTSNFAMVAFFKGLDFNSCWNCIYEVGNTFKLCLFGAYQAKGVIQAFPSIIIFFTFANLTANLIGFASILTNYLTGIFQTSVSGIVADASDKFRYLSSIDETARYERKIQREEQDIRVKR